MAITTFAELKTAIQNWSHRSDLDSVCGDFITLAESRFNDALRQLAMESDETLTLNSGSRTVAFPTGMRELKSLSIDKTSYREPLVQVSISALDDYIGTGDEPCAFAVTDQIEVDTAPSSNLTLIARVIKNHTGLSDSNTSNALLTSHPNVYLFGALSELYAYVQDADMQANYDMKFQEAVKLANRTAHRSRKNAKLTSDGIAGLVGYSSFDILRD